MSRPTIAILCGTGQAHSVQKYKEQLAELGAHGRIMELGSSVSRDALQGVDGVLVPDGGPVDARSYSAGKPCNAPNVQFDRAEIELVGQAIHKNIPVLGVGRGMRIVNVAAGGVLDHTNRTAAAQALSLLAPGFAAVGLQRAGVIGEIMHRKKDHVRGVAQERDFDTSLLVMQAQRLKGQRKR